MLKPLRIMTVLDLRTTQQGSMEEYLIRLSRMLRERGGHSVVVVHSCGQELLALFEASGATVLQIHQDWRSLGYALQLVRAIWRFRPNVVVLNFFPVLNLFPLLIRLTSGIQCVYVDHHSGTGRRNALLKRFILTLLYKASMGPCSRVIAVSEFVKKRQVQYCHTPADKVFVVYNGVRGATSEERQRASALRAELAIAPDAPVTMGVGYMIREKGFHVLMEAMAEVVKNIPNATLLLAR